MHAWAAISSRWRRPVVISFAQNAELRPACSLGDVDELALILMLKMQKTEHLSGEMIRRGMAKPRVHAGAGYEKTDHDKIGSLDAKVSSFELD